MSRPSITPSRVLASGWSSGPVTRSRGPRLEPAHGASRSPRSSAALRVSRRPRRRRRRHLHPPRPHAASRARAALAVAAASYRLLGREIARDADLFLLTGRTFCQRRAPSDLTGLALSAPADAALARPLRAADAHRPRGRSRSGVMKRGMVLGKFLPPARRTSVPLRGRSSLGRPAHHRRRHAPP